MRLLAFFLAALLLHATAFAAPIRVLFLGHASEHHNSGAYYPMLTKALGSDAIYFDYVETVEEALGDPNYLDRFDALLLYANHETIEPEQWKNLLSFVEEKGKGFVPVHCASWCFSNEPGFEKLVGGRFDSHKGGIFRARTLGLGKRAPLEASLDEVKDLPEFEAWDETYKHKNHNETDRVVLQVREVANDDNITKPEPWTWVRTQGKGRVFYTASGHDQRVWEKDEFHQLLKKGILWSVGEKRAAEYRDFLASRPPLKFEKRDNIPNYENRPEPLPYQLPLAAEDSMKYTRAPVGFRLELFASEPDIINPIAMAWDERGRCWAIETVDYPNTVRTEDVGDDKIKILEDTNGDGKCDKVTVFAEGLNIPTSITFSGKGVIVAMAPHFLYLEDTDGDDVADVKKVLFSGWGNGDTHAGPSNLRYGIDNCIWGAVGYSRFTGELGGKDHNFGSGLFRFRPDASAIEFQHQFNNNTWGLGFNAAGDVFGSTANNNPSFWGAVPATAFPEGSGGRSAEMIAETPKFHPITPRIRQVDAFGAYTAGAGHAFANSDRFPESWRDKMAFVCGPTGNLLGGYLVEENETGYTAKNFGAIVASADEWFSPVAAELGPDGDLWIADWYNFIIQHNPTPSEGRGGYAAERGPGNAHINPNRDREHGRIYRLIWEGKPEAKMVSLADATTDQLVAALDHPNQFWRLTAQRLLVQGGKEDAGPSLRERLGQPGVGAIHALHAFAGLQLEEGAEEVFGAALTAKDPALRRAAIKALPGDKNGADAFFSTSVLADTDPRTQLAAVTKLAEFSKDDERVKRAVAGLSNDPIVRESPWLMTAVKAVGGSSGGRLSFKLGENLLPNPGFEELDDKGHPKGWTPRFYSGNQQLTEHDVTGGQYKRNGERAIRIASARDGGGADTSWTAAGIKVKKNTEYRLSGWVKTNGLAGARGAQMNVHEIQGGESGGRTQGLRKRNDWTEVECFFNSGSVTEVSINCLYGGWGRSTGAAFWDDVALQEVIPVVGEEKELTGNADRGKEIVLKHEIAGCIRCHQLGGEGGVIGPKLDGIASRKGPDYLRESLVAPAKTLAEGFEKLGASPMPPMNLVLTPQELEDVLAYLATLKE